MSLNNVISVFIMIISLIIKSKLKVNFFHKKEKKVSFIPLENSNVETMGDNKYIFIVKDKFKDIVFKTTSK